MFFFILLLMVYQKRFQKDFSVLVPNLPSCLEYGILLYTAEILTCGQNFPEPARESEFLRCIVNA